MNQGFNYGVVGVIMSSCRNGMSVYMIVASNMQHDSYVKDIVELGDVPGQQATSGSCRFPQRPASQCASTSGKF